MDLTQNYFELFALPQSFSVDGKKLSESYLKLQTDFHPDKFASKSSSEQRLAVQFASYINTAYRILKSPLARAEYLLNVSGCVINQETLTVKNNAFLFKQMEWRESLAGLSDALLSGELKLPKMDVSKLSDQLDSLTQEVDAERSDLIDQFTAAYQQQEYDKATECIAEWHFVEKMQTEIETLEESLFE